MARTPKKKVPQRSADELRGIILQYFYDRSQNATSARGKKGFSVKISDVRRELKESHQLSQTDVVGNLNYLMGQGWIEEEVIEKTVPVRSGMTVPQSTSFYKITAAGIDKIEGPGEYTMEKFSGIKIEATGQNIITVGDGNQVNAEFADAAGALVELKEAILSADGASEATKLDAFADIETIESQLAKSNPNPVVVSSAWDSVRNLDTTLGLAEKIAKAGALLAAFL